MKARRAHLFPNTSHTLSISMPCDEGYMAIFDTKRLYIITNWIVLLHGIRGPHKNLYMVSITTDKDTVQPQLNIKHMENLGGIKNS